MCSDILMIIALWCLLKHYSYNKGYKQGDYDGYRRYHYNQICIDCKNHNTSCPNYHGYCKWEHSLNRS